MRQQAIFQVDAFTDQPFSGNPAAVCPMSSFPDDALMQAIAMENNLAETAFIVHVPGDMPLYRLRWFTPTTEVKLCGHATLASAHVVLSYLQPDWVQVNFETLSGVLSVSKIAGRYEMDFPNLNPTPMETPSGLAEAMGAAPAAVFDANTGDDDLLVVYDTASIVENLSPDPAKMAALAPFGFIVTAPGEGDVDFVTRCFFPNKGIPEDPVTGSAHCAAGPYWAERLGKASLFARQVSERGGSLWLEIVGDRVKISGHAVEVMQGNLFLP